MTASSNDVVVTATIVEPKTPMAKIAIRCLLGSMLVAALLGLITGLWWNSMTPVLYESEAQVLIEKRAQLMNRNRRMSGSTSTKRHEFVFQSTKCLEKCLSNPEVAKLEPIKSVGSSPRRKLQLLKNRTTLEPKSSDGSVYSIRIRWEDPDDAQMITNHFVDACEKMINMPEHFASDLSEKFVASQKKMEQVQQAISELQSDSVEPILDEDIELVAMQTLHSRLSKNRSELKRQLSQQKKLTSAIESNGDEMTRELLWLYLPQSRGDEDSDQSLASYVDKLNEDIQSLKESIQLDEKQYETVSKQRKENQPKRERLASLRQSLRRHETMLDTIVEERRVSPFLRESFPNKLMVLEPASLGVHVGLPRIAILAITSALGTTFGLFFGSLLALVVWLIRK